MDKRLTLFLRERGPGLLRDLHVYGGIAAIGYGVALWAHAAAAFVAVGALAMVLPKLYGGAK